ncbi:MAG: hypothetical protein GY934_03770, partial [Gammaproteobacteria bacterium]|nr:hypothetical protein [Gammaproteobacteria bacterium]
MAASEALWGGFASFFSIWQVCILQISPFFMAYITAIYLVARRQVADPGAYQRMILPYFAYVAGFTALYSLLIASGFGISRTLLYHVGDLRLLSGIVIFLVGLYILLIDHVAILERTPKLTLMCILSLLIGLTFAIIYSPCITPTLSEIMGIAVRPQSASTGFVLALVYGLGLCLALGMTGVALVLLLKKTRFVIDNIHLVKDICGIIVLIPGLLNITGYMTHYKAF